MFKVVIAVAFLTLQAGAQSVDATGASKAIHLAVVSVKPSPPGAERASYQTTADSIVVIQSPLWSTVSIAFGIEDIRALVGLPDWAMEERFDILVKIEEDDLDRFAKLSSIDRGKLLESVLVDRFGLKSHTETREFPVWSLVVAKGGPKLTPATRKADADNGLIIKITGRYRLDAKNATMVNLCHMVLSTEAQLLTVDDTHLDGRYDFSLLWTRPDQQGTYDAPEIFEAVRQQLGLNMVKRTLAETVLVVDQVHRPTPN